MVTGGKQKTRYIASCSDTYWIATLPFRVLVYDSKHRGKKKEQYIFLNKHEITKS